MSIRPATCRTLRGCDRARSSGAETAAPGVFSRAALRRGRPYRDFRERPQRPTLNVGSRAGLTLIEVLLAAAILAAGLTALLTGASRCLAVMKRSQQYQTAQWSLNLGELENPLVITNEVDDMAVSPVTFDNGYTYSRDVDEEDTEDEDHLYVVRSRVTWAKGGRDFTEEVVRYAYVPE
jgi:hypothetical protein